MYKLCTREEDAPALFQYRKHYVSFSFLIAILLSPSISISIAAAGKLAVTYLGLCEREVSLVSRIGRKFSYCLGNIDDPNYAYNQLIFGDGAKIEGHSTPLEVISNSLYYLTLEGISVGEKKLDISPDTFVRRRFSGEGGVVIDSGTTNTLLSTDAFYPLRDEVRRTLAAGLLQEVAIRPGVCYRGKVREDLKWFPVVTFHFAEGADLVLDVDAMFKQVHDNTFCMAVEESGRGVLYATVIGIRAQQYYNVAYDLDARPTRLYLQRIDCQLLES